MVRPQSFHLLYRFRGVMSKRRNEQACSMQWLQVTGRGVWAESCCQGRGIEQQRVPARLGLRALRRTDEPNCESSI